MNLIKKGWIRLSEVINGRRHYHPDLDFNGDGNLIRFTDAQGNSRAIVIYQSNLYLLDETDGSKVKLNTTTDISITDGQIVVGTGTGVEGTTKFTYDDTDDAEILTITGRILILGTGKSVIIGENAGSNDDFTTNENIFIGVNAGKENISGISNVCIGRKAGQDITNQSYNIFIGEWAGINATGGQNIIAIGENCLKKLTSGNTNIAIGENCMQNSTTTNGQNIAMGYAALGYTSTLGAGNIALGYFSLYKSTGSHNISFGQSSFPYISSGSNNIAIGTGAGQYYGAYPSTTQLATSNNSLFLGGSTRASADNANNQIALGYGAESQGDDTFVAGNGNITDFYAGHDAQAKVNCKTLNINTVPTSASGLVSGDIWNDGGTLKIVT